MTLQKIEETAAQIGEQYNRPFYLKLEGNWMMDVEKAIDAMEEHERQEFCAKVVRQILGKRNIYKDK